uniref:Movement protein TGB2 n=1 Tax=Mentha arvensis robigovirus 1 TaxID=3077297 RepID=A0AA96HCL6_9VIRU|nr:TGBp2 [Mentha arvensis robigovirus 1]
MSLTPPPNYSLLLLPAAAGCALAFVINALRSNNLPHTGDNIHSLPYGGSYSDGTKVVNYGGSHFLARGQVNNSFIPLLSVLIISFLIYVSNKLSRPAVHFVHYSRGDRVY